MSNFTEEELVSKLEEYLQKKISKSSKQSWLQIGVWNDSPIFSFLKIDEIIQDPKTGELKEDAAEIVRKGCAYDVRDKIYGVINTFLLGQKELYRAVKEFEFSQEDVAEFKNKFCANSDGVLRNITEKNKNLRNIRFCDDNIKDQLKKALKKKFDDRDWTQIGVLGDSPIFSSLKIEDIIQDPKTGELKEDAAEIVRKGCAYDVREQLYDVINTFLIDLNKLCVTVREFRLPNECICKLSKKSKNMQRIASEFVTKNENIFPIFFEEKFIVDVVKIVLQHTFNKNQWIPIGEWRGETIFSGINVQNLLQDPKTGELKEDAAEIVRKGCAYDVPNLLKPEILTNLIHTFLKEKQADFKLTNEKEGRNKKNQMVGSDTIQKNNNKRTLKEESPFQEIESGDLQNNRPLVEVNKEGLEG